MSTTYPYLGTPGAMVQLPGPNGDVTVTPSRSETLHPLLSGGVAKTQRPLTKRTFSIPYTNRPGIGLDDTLYGFYAGLFDVVGTDFVFVNPARRNVLDMDVSTMGLRPVVASPATWQGTGTFTETSGGPTGVTSGVLQWAGGVASGTILPGLSGSLADPASAPVVLPAEPVTVSIYMKASASATITLAAAGRSATGANVSAVTTSCAVTTSWQRFSVSVAAGGLGASVLVVPRLTMPSSGVPASLFVAAAQVEYASSVSAFQPGYGSPRVLLASSPGDTRSKWDGYSTHTLTLQEV